MLTKKNKVLITMAMLLFIGFEANAEKSDSACSTNVTKHFGFIGPGISWVDIGKLNDFLSSRGISPFDDVVPSISLGGKKEMHRLMVESNLDLRYWKNHTNANVRTSLFSGDMTWNTGVNLLPQSVPATAFPFVGIGVGLNTIRVRSDSKTFDELVTSSEPDALLWQTAFLINAGAGTDLVLSKKDSKKGLALGLRAGYLFDPFSKNGEWRSNGTKISDVPDLKQNGAYIRLIIGGWGGHNR